MLIAVRSSPWHGFFSRLALPEHLSLLSICSFSASLCLLPPPSHVLSDALTVEYSLLSRSLSGGELPLDDLHAPAAAVAAAPTLCASHARRAPMPRWRRPGRRRHASGDGDHGGSRGGRIEGERGRGVVGGGRGAGGRRLRAARGENGLPLGVTRVCACLAARSAGGSADLLGPGSPRSGF